MDCAICQEAIDVRTTGRAELSCSHKYHLSCIATWYQTNDSHTCPMCRKVAEPLERIGGSAPAKEPTVPITLEEIENILRANNGFGIKICSNLFFEYDSHSSAGPGSREWFNTTIRMTRKELHRLCGGNGACPLSDDEWDELLSHDRTTNPYSSRHGSGGWIRVDRDTLDKLLKASGGEGISHEYSMALYTVRYDYDTSAPMPRTTFDAILECQSSSMTSDAKWNMIMGTFKNDMSRRTPKASDFDWDAYGEIDSDYKERVNESGALIVEAPERLTMTREQVAGVLESLRTPATVEEFFNEEDWMEQTLVTTTTLDQLNARLEYLNTLHPAAQIELLTVADFHSVRTRCMPPPAEALTHWSDNIQWIRHDSPPIRVILNPEEEEYWDV